MTEQILQIESVCDPKAMARHLTDYLGHLRADIKPIAETANLPDAFEGTPDVAVTGTGSGLFGLGNWAVQAYLSARNGGSLITLRAIGDDTAPRASNARRSTPSLTSSVKKMESLALLLRAMDTGTRRQRLNRP
jgi:hypothetical protein